MGTETARLGDHPGECRRGPVARRRADRPGRVDPLAEAGDIGAVDDRSPVPRRHAFADVELHRVGPDIDDRDPRRTILEQRDQALRIARVHVAVEADRCDGRHDRRRIRILDGDGPDGPAVRHDIGDLGRAPADRVPDAALVHLDRADALVRSGHVAKELVQRRPRPIAGRRVDPERRRDRGDICGGQREVGLQDGLPSFEAGAVDLPQELDVQQLVPDLDRGAAGAEQIELVALLDPGRRHRGEGVLRRPESMTERAPFPARDDHGHRRCSGPLRAASRDDGPSTHAA